MRRDTFSGTCTAGSSDSRVAGCCKHVCCIEVITVTCCFLGLVCHSLLREVMSSLSTVDVTQNTGLTNDCVNITDVVKYLFSKRLVCVARLVL